MSAMNQTIRSYATSRGIQRARTDYRNHQAGEPAVSRALITDVCRAARPGAWWLTILWLRRRYATRIEGWYRAGYRGELEKQQQAAPWHSFIRYTVRGSAASTFRRPGA